MILAFLCLAIAYASGYVAGQIYDRVELVVLAWCHRSHRARRRLGRLGLLAVLLLAACSVADASPRHDCGEERAAVKLGLDADAPAVNTRPVDTTIAELVALPRPRVVPVNRRADTTERTVYRIHGTITAYKLEADGDYHIVIADSEGRHMIVEIPAPGCAASGVWGKQVAAARDVAARALRPADKLRRTVVRDVTVTGVGFWDVPHGQVGVAKNAIELHPVLAIEIGGGS